MCWISKSPRVMRAPDTPLALHQFTAALEQVGGIFHQLTAPVEHLPAGFHDILSGIGDRVAALLALIVEVLARFLTALRRVKDCGGGPDDGARQKPREPVRPIRLCIL